MAAGSSRFHLGVIELSTHENFLTDLCSIATESAELTVFTTEDIRERVREDVTALGTIEWVVLSNGGTRASLSTIEERCSTDLDALWSFPFYGTVLDYLRYARFDPSCPFVLSAYDLNGWLGHSPAFTPKVYNYLKFPLKRRLLGRVDALTVEFEPIAEYVGSNAGTASVRTFTPVLYDGGIETTDADADGGSLVVSVPGMIDRTRRDYDVLLDAIACADRASSAPIEVVFLGRPVDAYGERVVSRANALESEGVVVTTFDEWIPTGAFAEHLARSDLLVSPLRRTRRIDGFVEEYGTSKGSGAISDAIRHATPLALPEWYAVPERVAPGVTTFDGPADLGDLLAELADDGATRERFARGAREMAEAYTLAEQQARFRDVIDAAMGD